MSILALTLALNCFLPIFNGTFESAGVSVVNSSANLHTVGLTAISSLGQAIDDHSLELPAGVQKAFMLSEVFSGSPLPGLVRVTSTGDSCPAFLTVVNEQSLAAAEGTGMGHTALVLPYIRINTGFVELGHTDTRILLGNPSANFANVSLELSDLEGKPAGAVTVIVPPSGSLELRLSDAFANALPSNNAGGKRFEGYLRMQSAAAIFAWELVETPLSQTMLLAQPASLAQAVSYFPHFAFNDVYDSVVNIVNPAATAVMFELTAMSSNGLKLADPILVTLGPGEARRALVADLFPIALPAIFPPPLVTGFIRVREANSNPFLVAGNVELRTHSAAGPFSSALESITTAPANRRILPFALDNATYFTGYVVINPDSLLTVQNGVVADFHDGSGALMARRIISLSPGSRAVELVRTAGKAGYVRFTADFPIHVFATIGTRDNRTLDAIPGIP